MTVCDVKNNWILEAKGSSKGNQSSLMSVSEGLKEGKLN